MSFLAEVLSSNENIELEQISDKVNDISSSVGIFKNEVISYLEHVHIKCITMPVKSKQKILLRDAHKLQEEMGNLRKNAEYITKKNKDMEKHIEVLNDANLTLCVCVQLCEIQECLMTFFHFLQTKSFVKCMELILQIKEEIKLLPVKTEERIEGIILKLEQVPEPDFVNDLTNILRDKISFEVNEKANILRISTDEDIEQILLALYLRSPNIDYLNSLTSFIWMHIFIPIVKHRTEIKIGNDKNCSIIDIKQCEAKPKYVDVFSSLKMVLQFLLQNFNINLTHNFTSLAYIGKEVNENLKDFIIKNCLRGTEPTTTDELQKYGPVVEETKQFEAVLKECKICDENDNSLADYVDNVQLLFIKEKCLRYKEECLVIMKEGLQDMIKIGAPYDSKNPFHGSVTFKQCCVSKTVIKLVDYLEKVIAEATSSSEYYAISLVSTVQEIFELYSKFIGKHHKKLIQTLPLQAALFYNNCMYISYKMTQWNETNLENLHSTVNMSPVGIKFEIPQIEICAIESFNSFVDMQIKDIEEIILKTGLNVPVLEELGPYFDKYINQCTNRLEVLRKEWNNILSHEHFNRSMGIILNYFCDIILNAIMKFQYISHKVVNQLIECLKNISFSGSKIFLNIDEVKDFVPSLCKVDELIVLLDSNLVDIKNIWVKRKGHLKSQLQPDEIRKIVTALFPEDNYKTEILSKIHIDVI